MDRRIVLFAVVAASAAAGLWIATAPEAEAKRKFKPTFTFHLSVDPDPDHVFAVGAAVKDTVIDGTPGIVVSTFYNLIDVGIGAPSLIFVIPNMDYAAAAYPLNVPVRNIWLSLCVSSSGTEVKGMWFSGEGGGFTVDFSSYDAKARRLTGSFAWNGVPWSVAQGYGTNQPIDITGEIALVVPNYDGNPSRLSFTSSRVPQVEFRESRPKRARFPYVIRQNGALHFRELSFYPNDRRIGAPWIEFWIDETDWASLTFPAIVPVSGVYFETRQNGCSQRPVGLGGSWRPPEGAKPVVTLTDYAPDTKQLSGTFSFSLVSSEDGPNVVSGSFTQVVPKPKKK